MSIEEIDRRLAAELGDVAHRMPLPPLPEIHRRAARRHRARIARRTAGTAAVAVVVSMIAFGGSHLAADKGVTPVTDPPGDHTSCLTYQTDAKSLDTALLRLPEHVPAGTAFRQTQFETTQQGCGFPAAGAFAVDAATSSITRAITFTVYPLDGRSDGPAPGECRRISSPGQTGTCARARITGDLRWSWRTSGLGGWRTSVSWAQDGQVWWAHAAGMSSTELDAALAGLRVSGERVVRGTLPRGLSQWLAPAQDPEVHTLIGQYLPLPENGGGSTQDDPAGDVQVEVTDDPFAVPHADPMAMSGNGGAQRPVRLVDVGGAEATWREDDVDGDGTLTWQADDGVTIRVSGGRLTLDEALRVARSMRPVGIDDERLTCDPDKNPWGSCGG